MPRRSTRGSGSRWHGCEESLIALGEAGAGLGAYLEGLDADPARQELVERRVAAIDDLARKHRVEGSALPAKLDELQRHARGPRAVGDWRSAASTNVSRGCARVMTRPRRSSVRRGAARRASSRTAVTGLMRQLGMPGGRFEIGVESDADAEPQPRVRTASSSW